jgi:hypothetical protein
MPAGRIITVRAMRGKQAESEVGKVPVSDNAISRRVDDVSRATLKMYCVKH